MARIEKIAANGINIASSAIQKSDNKLQKVKFEGDANKLTDALNGLASSNSILIKKDSLLGVNDIALLKGDKTKINIYSADKSDNIRRIPFYFDADNSKAIPEQGYMCSNPIQEAYLYKRTDKGRYNLAMFLRDMQYNNGKLSKRAIKAIKELGLDENELLQKINDNLTTQKKALEKLQPSTDDCILYRFLNLNYERKNLDDFIKLLSSLKVGDKTVLDWSPVHAAGDPKFLSQMSRILPLENHTIFRIKTPKGSKLIHGGADNLTKEMIFPSKAEFKLLDRNKFDSVDLWDFEYVLTI